jgi:hypothetical protein
MSPALLALSNLLASVLLAGAAPHRDRAEGNPGVPQPLPSVQERPARG